MSQLRHVREDGGRYHPDEMIDAIRRQTNLEMINGVERIIRAPGCHVETRRAVSAVYTDFHGGERAYYAHMHPNVRIDWQSAPIPKEASGRDSVLVFSMALGNGSPLPQPSGRFDLFVDGEKTLSFRVVKHSETWRGPNGVTLFYHVGRLHAVAPDQVLHLDYHLTAESFASVGTAFLRIPAALTHPGRPLHLSVVPVNTVPSERWFRLDCKPVDGGAGAVALRQDLCSGVNALLAGRTHPRVGEHNVYFGDIHEHSGHGPQGFGHLWNACGTGSVEENYIYGRDIANLDFFGLADHEGDILDERGWTLRKETAARCEEPGVFATLLCFEWTNMRFGHRNVYYRGLDGPLIFPWRETDPAKWDRWDAFTPEDLWRALDAWGGRAITAPHHPPFALHPFCWEYSNPKYDRFVEIYSCWGSSEFPENELPGHASDRYAPLYVRQALDRGYRFGLLASSDGHDGRPGNNQSPDVKHHHMFHHLGSGRAAVLADDLCREVVFDALHARRCYATTGEPIVMAFTCNGHVMGSELPEGTPAVFECHVRGTCALTRMVVVKNGKARTSFPVETAEERHTWVDPDGPEGGAYYYLKAVQRDGEMAWSSPIWIG